MELVLLLLTMYYQHFLLFEAFINRDFVKQHIAVLVVVFIVQAVLASSDFTAVQRKKRIINIKFK